jgi:hypothetical protein
VTSYLEEKVAVLGSFAPSDRQHLVLDNVRAGAHLWGRQAGGGPAEPFESQRGVDPFSTRGNGG